jgi:hypothetical protein
VSNFVLNPSFFRIVQLKEVNIVLVGPNNTQFLEVGIDIQLQRKCVDVVCQVRVLFCLVTFLNLVSDRQNRLFVFHDWAVDIGCLVPLQVVSVSQRKDIPQMQGSISAFNHTGLLYMLDSFSREGQFDADQSQPVQSV